MIDILLVEDHQELNSLMKRFLERDGYSVAGVFSGEEAISFLAQEQAKLIVLDVMLPGMDGFAVCAKIRSGSNIPILFLSARVEKEDKLNGFMQGADDYVEKPVDMDVLLYKIKALFRRNYQLKQENDLLISGAITVDTKRKQVFLHQKEISLTVKEYELLILLIQNAGKALQKDYLFNTIWGMDSFSENQTLTVHIKMLRDKIEDIPKRPQRILTVWGIGYRYEEV